MKNPNKILVLVATMVGIGVLAFSAHRYAKMTEKRAPLTKRASDSNANVIRPALKSERGIPSVSNANAARIADMPPSGVHVAGR
jgi:hypothetical protein